MFRTLQSRLWLTYLLLIVTVISILAVGIIVYVVRNPVMDRQTLQQLEVMARVVKRLSEEGTLRSAFTLRRIEGISEQFSLRIIIFDERGSPVFDSGEGQANFSWREVQREIPSRGIIRDLNSQPWLYTSQPLDSGRTMFLAAPRQGGLSLLSRPQFREVLRDDLLPPFIRAGGVALILALLLAYWMSRWISTPMSSVTTAARKVADGEYHTIEPQGPQEVRTLTQAFNEMIHKVKSSQQSQRDFVANVSHELKTPLTSIQGFAQAMLDGTVGSLPEMKNSARIIRKEAERMYRLVLDLLELARYDAGTVQLAMRRVDLDELLSQVVEKMDLRADQKGIDLSLALEPLPAFSGDPDRLAQVFSNLIDNALKYTPAGGKVEIKGERRENEVRFSVIDTGKGIPEEELSRVFDRFYQVDKSRSKEQEPSSGLGLAITREIVQAHGGQIAVRSQLGEGSHFQVVLPLDVDSARGKDG